MLFTAIYGGAVERVAYRPLRGSVRLAPLISAIGTSIFLQNYVQILQGAREKPMPPLVEINGSSDVARSDRFVSFARRYRGPATSGGTARAWSVMAVS